MEIVLLVLLGSLAAGCYLAYKDRVSAMRGVYDYWSRLELGQLQAKQQVACLETKSKSDIEALSENYGNRLSELSRDFASHRDQCDTWHVQPEFHTHMFQILSREETAGQRRVVYECIDCKKREIRQL